MKRQRVLVVDDEKSFTRLLKLNLEEVGEYEVRVENKAAWAVEAMREFEPDIILMDIVMPHMSGQEVAEEMKTAMKNQQVPILYLSAAMKWQDDGRLGGPALEHPVISKPVSLAELRTHMEQAVGAR